MQRTEDENNVLKDGEALRVPAMMMDAATPAPLAGTYIADHHQPRHGTLTGEQRNAAVERQKAYEKRLGDAWKNPAPANLAKADRHPPIQGVAALAPVITADELQARREAMQAKYDERVANAWRHEPKGAA